jgi:hypothetical protein
MKVGDKTKAKAMENEADVLKLLARFSWLTSQQIGLIIWNGSSSANQMSNRTLKRMLSKNLIMSEPLNAKHFSNRYRAYYLSELGRDYVEAFYPEGKIYGYFGSGRKNDKGETYFLMGEKEHYHRFITNQFMIELELYGFDDMWKGDKILFNESKVIANKRRFKNTLGSVPDSFFVVNNEIGEIGYVVETENVKRGPRKHGAKFYDFMDSFFQQVGLSNSDKPVYRPSVHELPEVSGDEHYSLHIKTIFLCRDESIFRNIYRKVQRVIDDVITVDEVMVENNSSVRSGGLDGFVYYLILNSEKNFQKTILGACEIVDHEYAAQRVEDGSRKYKYSDERMLNILEEYRDTGITMRELCERHDINSANVYRWNKRFNIFKPKKNIARSWG